MGDGLVMRSDRRNLHLHEAAVRKLRAHPELRAKCLAVLERWSLMDARTGVRPHFDLWRELLTTSTDDELARVVLDPAAGQTLRSNSPLTPVLDESERLSSLRAFQAAERAGG